MSDSDSKRRRAIRGLAEYLRRRSFPRLALGIVLALTGLAGFGISFLLLKAGIGDMWLRYPVAVLGAYGIFLLLMRAWVEIEQMQINPEDPELLDAIENGSPEPPSSIRKDDDLSWLEWLDVPGADIFDAEGCLPVILIGVVVALIGLAIMAVLGAPVLVAEVLLDLLLAGILYRRLKRAAEEHWLGTCIRKTWGLVLCTALLLSIAGFALSVAAPEAQSIGPAIKKLLEPQG